MRGLVIGVALTIAACAAEAPEDAALRSEPLPIGDHEGAVCGMVVRDQSAPRAQVVHRDGERAFLCSIGDLLAYLRVPSPHGAAEAVLVEVMEPSEDPLEIHLAPHPWIPASEAVFVVGIARRSIMGEPVLVYRTEEDAAQVLTGQNARILRFAELERWWLGVEEGEHP